MRRFKLWRPQSLFARTLLILCVPTVLVQLVTSFVFYDRHWDTLARRMSASLGSEIALVANLLGPMPPTARQDFLQQAEKTLHIQFSFVALDALDLPEQAKFDTPVDRLLFEALDERLEQKFYATLQGDANTAKIIVPLDDGFLIAYANKNRLFSYTTNLVMWWMTGSSVLLFGIAIVFLRNQMRPIRKLAEAAEELGKGQDSGDLKPSGAIEVRQATSAFILMRERIKRQIQQRTEMLAGISHDLRTPLTRMKLELALLPQNSDVQAIAHDVDEMRQMVDSYLSFARGDSEEESASFDLDELLLEIHNDAARQGRSIKISGQGAEYHGRRQAIKRCISNLVENACRYGSEVTMTTEIRPHKILIHVDDNGPGIPPEMYEEVFRPFRRLDESRNAETGGVGLGLSIARDVARSHGGDIILAKSKQGGLRATLSLPV